MNTKLITRKDEEVTSYFSSLEKALKLIEYLTDNYCPPFNGEHYLTDKQLSRILNISRRTLQDYRTQGLLSYIQFGGKILYKESDVQRLLDNAYREAFT